MDGQGPGNTQFTNFGDLNMEPITLTAIAVFLAPYLKKAGEKIAEKTVEALFESRKDLAGKFAGLFGDEIITLGLNEPSTEKAMELLDAKPELKEVVRRKVENNRDLLETLAEALTKQEGRTITATNYFEKVETVNIDQRRP